MITGTTLHLNKSSSAKDIMTYLKNGLAVGDYYQEKGQSFGIWGGSLAPSLGLEKTANITEQKEAFINLLQGCHPATGQLLKAHKARAHGVAGYDFVAAPDKSVSIMALFDERIIQAHVEANAEAMAEVEKYASRRMRSGPSHNRVELPNKFTGNFLYCSFLHDLSRANEPQTHSHNFILNMTMDEDGNFYSLDQKEMKRSIRYHSTAYASSLAKKVANLGYEVEPVMHQGRTVSFRIKSVPLELCQKNSSRRKEILIEGKIYQEENKLDRALSEAERDIIARETRANKKLLSEQEKKVFLQSRIGNTQWQALEEVAKDAKKEKAPTKKVAYEKAVNLAIEHLFERKSTVALREILTEVMTQHFGNLDLSGLQKYLSNEQNMDKHQLLDLELLRECPVAEKYVTTDRSLEREAYAVNVVNKGIEKCQPFNESFAPFASKAMLEHEEKNHLNFDHQRLLVNEILVSRDRYLNIQGKAGSGKTTMLKELIRGIQVNTDRVIALAPTNSAVDTLKDNDINAMTVSKFLSSCNKHELDNSTIIVDEAGLLSSSQGAQLLYFAEQTNSRIIFQGDTRQHSSVEAGDFVRGLEQYSKILTFGLNNINRQKDEDYRKAVELLSDCKTAEGLTMLDEQGRIKERSDYIRSAVEDYKKEYFTDSGSCLYVATTNYEVDKLNEQIRAKVKSFGENLLTNEEARTIFLRSNMTIARSKQARSYSPGDYIYIHRKFQSFRGGEYLRVENTDSKNNRIFLENGKFINLDNHYSDITHGYQRHIDVAEGDKIICTYRDREHELFNGEALTIQQMHCKVDGKDYVKCINSNGKVKFMPLGFRHYKHGYAVTSHRSQGMTVDNVVVVANNLNSESAYVALSRGRYGCQIHTPNKYDLINNAIDYVRPLAMDIIDHDHKRNRLQQIDHTKELARLEKDFGPVKEQKLTQQRQYEIWKEHTQEIEQSMSKGMDPLQEKAAEYDKEIRALVAREQELKKQIEERQQLVYKLNDELTKLKGRSFNRLFAPVKAKKHKLEVAEKEKALKEAIAKNKETDLKKSIKAIRKEKTAITLEWNNYQKEYAEKAFEKQRAMEISEEQKVQKEMMQETFGFGKEIPKHEMSELDLEIAEIRQEIKEINKKKNALEKELNKIEIDLSLPEKLRKEGEFDFHERSHSELQQEYDILMKLNKKYDRQIEALLAKETEIEMQNRPVEEKIEELEKERGKLKKELVPIQNQLSWADILERPLSEYHEYKGADPASIPPVRYLRREKGKIKSRLAEIKEEIEILEGKSIDPTMDIQEKQTDITHKYREPASLEKEHEKAKPKEEDFGMDIGF